MDLDALKKALAALPKTPWTFEEDGIDAGVVGTDRRVNPMYGERCEGAVYDDDTDAAAIVAIVNALPGILSELSAARECVASASAMLNLVESPGLNLEAGMLAIRTYKAALAAYDAATEGGG